MGAGMEVTGLKFSDRERLNQSAIVIALYHGRMDTFLDPTNYLPV